MRTIKTSSKRAPFYNAFTSSLGESQIVEAAFGGGSTFSCIF